MYIFRTFIGQVEGDIESIFFSYHLHDFIGIHQQVQKKGTIEEVRF